ncbi:MAG: acyl-CoA dehydrogenase family protein [Burkholderiales bacterium]
MTDSKIAYTAEKLIERARALVPKLRERAAQTSKARQVPRETIDDYLASNLFHLLKPAKFGGPEVRVDDAFAVAGELARGDGSAAWVWTVMGVHDLFVALFPQQAQEEYWANAKVLSASSFAPSGKASPTAGGYTLNGKWAFCSGVDHADWMILGAIFGMLDTSPPIPDIRFVLLPKSDLKAVIDDWHVMGLCGTGSKTVVAENIFIPEHRVASNADMMQGKAPGTALHSGGIYRVPVWALFPFCISSPAAGIARGAFDAFVEEMKARSARFDHSPLARKPNIQMRVSEAGALIDAADLLYKRSLRETIDLAMDNQPLPLELRIRNRRDQGYAIRTAKQATEILLSAQGGGGIYEHLPVQRAFRDLQAMSGHLVGNWDMPALNYGSVTMGGEPTDPFW